MPNYGAWGALADAGDSFRDAYMQAKNLQRQRAMNAVEMGLKSNESAKAIADTGLAQAKQKWYQGNTASMPDVPAMQDAGMSMPSQPQGLVPAMGDRSNVKTQQLEQGNLKLYADVQPNTEAQMAGGSNLPALPTGPQPRKILPGESPKDYSKYLGQWSLTNQKASLKPLGVGKTSNIPRGLATILSKSGFTTAESGRIDALPSAIGIHNQIVDAIQAFSNNDMGVANAAVKGYIAKHPNLSGFFQEYKANPNNQLALLNALTRMGSIEQFKLQNGSSAMPSEDAIRSNMDIYPTPQEIMAKSPVVAQKLNALVDTTISPALEGVMGRMGMMADPKTDRIGIPLLDTIYSNLKGQKAALGAKLHTLNGYQRQDGNMIIPPERSGMGGDLEAKRARLMELRAKAQAQ